MLAFVDCHVQGNKGKMRCLCQFSSRVHSSKAAPEISNACIVRIMQPKQLALIAQYDD
jgi:hypothetical protein